MQPLVYSGYSFPIALSMVWRSIDQALTRLHIAKGWFFVAVTATLLYRLVYRAVNLGRELPAGIGPAEDPDGGSFAIRSSGPVGMEYYNGGTELDGRRGFPPGL